MKLENVMAKKGYLAVTSRTRVSLSPGFHVPDSIRSAVPALPGSSKMTLQEALTSPVKTLTNIKGKVFEVRRNIFTVLPTFKKMFVSTAYSEEIFLKVQPHFLKIA